jgi:hypothetical protein
MHVYSSGTLDGKSYDKHYNFLFVSWIRTDLSEKYRNQTDAEKYQTWFPQTDVINLPSTNEVKVVSSITNEPATTATVTSTNSSAPK